MAIQARWDSGNIGAAVAFVRKSGVAGARLAAERLAKECETAAAGFRKAMATLDAGEIAPEDDDA